MNGEKLSPKLTFSMAFDRNRSQGDPIAKGTIAIWQGDYKLIQYLEEDESLLFNLRKDPNEVNNLINKKHEIGKHLLGLIQLNLKTVNERIDPQGELKDSIKRE